MAKSRVTPAQEQILRNQVIDATQPGPVLRDFQVVLDFVGTQGVKAAGKYNLLPIEAIGELDERLSRPLRLQLKRPQLRSHPYLQGLHLLLRASGLARVEGSGAKTRLAVDAGMLEQWQRLNATEQYFNLLEAWLLWGRPEMVGEQGSWLSGSRLFPCLQTWQTIPPQGQQVDMARPQWVFFHGIYRDFYQMALMDLFGLMEVEHPRQPVQPWCPAAVRHVPFGDAVFTLLEGEGFPFWAGAEMGEEEEEESNEEASTVSPGLGRWQPLFQPYFPAWQANLEWTTAGARTGTFVFRVGLGRIWRLIAIPAKAALDDLVSWILKSVNFDNDHLYEFTYRDRFGATVRAVHPYGDEGPWTDEVTIGDLPLEPGQSMQLTYDFGDNWQFDVRLERIEPPGAKLKAPRILERHGKAPEQYPDWD
jgi:hypothetical protein